MSNLKDVKLSATPYSHDIEYIYLLQCYDGRTVRSYRTSNPTRAFTVARQYCERTYHVQITVWVRVGDDCMIPMSHTACSIRDLKKVFEHLARDLACAESTRLERSKEDEYSYSDSSQE